LDLDSRSSIIGGFTELTLLGLARGRDVAFGEAIESHRIVVEHLSFELIGEILARF
jgi:hypothetical protein